MPDKPKMAFKSMHQAKTYVCYVCFKYNETLIRITHKVLKKKEKKFLN